MLTSTAAAICAVTAMVLFGCGNQDRLPTYRVTGKVLFKSGKPLDGGSIIFESVAYSLSARSVIEQDGSFHLGTYQKGDGAIAGEHRVAIIPPATSAVDPDEQAIPAVLPSRYTNPDESGLVFTVSDTKRNVFEIQVDEA